MFRLFRRPWDSGQGRRCVVGGVCFGGTRFRLEEYTTFLGDEGNVLGVT
jgi:hypothetical protein